MKNVKKYIIFILILFLLSGCSYESKVTLNDDGTVKEEVLILDSNDAFKSPVNTKKQVIENTISNYSSVINYRKYKYEIISGDSESGVKLYKMYDNICTYFQDTLFNQFVYKHIKCTENENSFVIENDTPHIPYCSDCSDGPYLDDSKLTITLPINAEENNADKVNKNTYTWVFNKYTPDDKTFYLKINKNSLIKKQESIKKHNRKINILTKFLVIGIITLILLLLLIISIKLYKKYKKNRIDY